MKGKIEIRVYKVCDAGMYEMRVLDLGIGDDMILKLNPGSPFKDAMRDAETNRIIDVGKWDECILT